MHASFLYYEQPSNYTRCDPTGGPTRGGTSVTISGGPFDVFSTDASKTLCRFGASYVAADVFERHAIVCTTPRAMAAGTVQLALSFNGAATDFSLIGHTFKYYQQPRPRGYATSSHCLALLAAAHHLARAGWLYAGETKAGLHLTGAWRRRRDLRGRARTARGQCRRAGCIALAGATRALRLTTCTTSAAARREHDGAVATGRRRDLRGRARTSRVRVPPHRAHRDCGCHTSAGAAHGAQHAFMGHTRGVSSTYQGRIRLIRRCVSG